VLADALERSSERTRLMLLLAAYAGLRRAEIAKLHTCDLVDGTMRIKGKGGRVRSVPIHPRIAAHLAGAPYGYLFPGSRGGHLSPDRVGRIMSDALGPGWTAHTLRHRFGTRLYAQSHDVLQAQQLLGHSSPATTQRYVRLPDDAAAAAVAAIA
jgi:integrase